MILIVSTETNECIWQGNSMESFHHLSDHRMIDLKKSERFWNLRSFQRTRLRLSRWKRFMKTPKDYFTKYIDSNLHRHVKVEKNVWIKKMWMKCPAIWFAQDGVHPVNSEASICLPLLITIVFHNTIYLTIIRHLLIILNTFLISNNEDRPQYLG